ncbi:MAG: phage integrase family protein [Noviherbaspirillum sp.]
MAATWISRGTVLIQLGRHHFAFFRGYLNGLDLRQLTERYIQSGQAELSGAGDLKAARSLVSWIEEQLMVAARRTGNASAARVLRMAPDKLGAQGSLDVPYLEEFRAERDPHQMFSERELLELFEHEYGDQTAGSERRAKRNARLHARQIAVLARLEEMVTADPRLEDGVAGWLDPAIARRLLDAGIRTLRELVVMIEAHGFRWYTKVPRIGIRAAQHIVEWLLLPETEAALGVRLPLRAIRPRKDIPATMLPEHARRQGIVPIEQFELPAAMRGAPCPNHAGACMIAARDDREAIMAWLARSIPGSNTARSYRKESERLLLWAVLEARTPVSSLTVEHCIAYRDFLQKLGRESREAWAQQFRIPQDRWLGPRGIDRFSSRWRPFEGPLSPSSQKTALVVVQSLMQWLCRQNYLNNNPFKKLPFAESKKFERSRPRALTPVEWQYATDYLASRPANERYDRLQIILALAYGAGCSLAEISSLRRSNIASLVQIEGKDTQWEINVAGKGKMPRNVQINEQVVAWIESHFRRRGYASLATVPACTPLIAAVPGVRSDDRGEASISAARIYMILKSFFNEVATSAALEDAELVATYRCVSPRWLQKTFAARGMDKGAGRKIQVDIPRGIST